MHSYTLADYVSLQRGLDIKLEYFNGDICVITSGSAGHYRISRNVLRLFEAALAASSCEAFGSDMRVNTPSGLYTYPDGSVICGPKVSNAAETLSNPIVIVEVLSDSTRNYDRGEKFDLYRSIPALRHYLLIEQNYRHVEHRRLESERTTEIVDSPDGIVRVSGVGVDLSISEIYEGVEIASLRPSS
jgi:Uma2 family endonuclease